MDCPTYLTFLLSFPFLLPIPSVTPGRFAHCLHTYLQTVLTFSRDFRMLLYASVSFHDLLLSSSSFSPYLYIYYTK